MKANKLLAILDTVSGFLLGGCVGYVVLNLVPQLIHEVLK